MASADVRDMTVRDLMALADEVRKAPPGSRKMRRAADRMAAVTWHLEHGALQQMLWWAGSDVIPEPPPDARDDDQPPPEPRGRLVQFPRRIG